MKKYSIAIALALFAGVVSMPKAQADYVLVPEFETSGSWVTFVTVVDSYANTSGLHWMYRADDTLTPTNECAHRDGTSTTTPNDMFTANIATGAVLGADTTSTALGIGAGQRGFLTLYNFVGTYNGNFVGPGVPPTYMDAPENTLYAEDAMLNLATNQTDIFRAQNDPVEAFEGGTDTIGYGSFFSIAILGLPGAAVPPMVVWNNTAAVSTKWDILVGHVSASTAPSGAGVPGPGNMTAIVTLSPVTGGLLGGFYDINETFISGLNEIPVDCFGEFVLADLVSPLNLSSAAAGGWSRMQMVNPLPNVDQKSIILYKDMTTTAVSGLLQSGTISQNRADF